MMMNRHTPVFGLTLWCLLSLWAFFGCLELAEQLEVVPEIAAENQDHQDFDEDALTQLASGLKSELSSLEASNSTLTSAATPEPIVSIPTSTGHPLRGLVRHEPRSLPLYKQFSVYRI